VQRQPANRYPQSDFPDAASTLVDAERRAHFESRYFLTLVWLPTDEDVARGAARLYEGRDCDGTDWLAEFTGPNATQTKTNFITKGPLIQIE
jgi:type IV secretion system protein VirB4